MEAGYWPWALQLHAPTSSLPFPCKGGIQQPTGSLQAPVWESNHRPCPCCNLNNICCPVFAHQLFVFCGPPSSSTGQGGAPVIAGKQNSTQKHALCSRARLLLACAHTARAPSARSARSVSALCGGSAGVRTCCSDTGRRSRPDRCSRTAGTHRPRPVCPARRFDCRLCLPHAAAAPAMSARYQREKHHLHRRPPQP